MAPATSTCHNHLTSLSDLVGTWWPSTTTPSSGTRRDRRQNQTQSLICKSDNTPNYQVNMAILYGRWKEVSIWLPESETALPTPLRLEEDGRHIDIITVFICKLRPVYIQREGRTHTAARRRPKKDFRGLTTTPEPSSVRYGPWMTAYAETSTLTPPICGGWHTRPRRDAAEESTPEYATENTLEECIIQHGN
ncbi:hypothetical protein BDFB_012654 [Asbolus verrucosus]|uniref:Uncharacterized protein n=1 Tax=Asbolus verrucosus TaxID=1661398 RepID=A0A482VSG8_ASBVE|nr:hypothetical protein BDFB_012654 [Asbolus verrucosus]